MSNYGYEASGELRIKEAHWGEELMHFEQKPIKKEQEEKLVGLSQ